MHSEKTTPVTVKELISLLQAMPPHAVVIIEGCDCTSEAVDVEVETRVKPPIVTICRGPL